MAFKGKRAPVKRGRDWYRAAPVAVPEPSSSAVVEVHVKVEQSQPVQSPAQSAKLSPRQARFYDDGLAKKLRTEAVSY